MSDIINSNKDFSFQISDKKQAEMICKITRALSNLERVEMLRLLENKPLTIGELSRELHLPKSTTALHAEILRDAQLIFIDYKPNKKGQIKLCSRSANRVEIILEDNSTYETEKDFQFEMPIGNYFDFDITTPCGLVGAEKEIGRYDLISTFCEPDRFKAELLWFQSGFVAYKFPNIEDRQKQYKSISFSLEFCSETVYSRNDWPSDITIWINGVEILTHTSPGDFGGRRGRYSPKYWFINSTQYGILNEFFIDESGCYSNGAFVTNKVKLSDLRLADSPYIIFKIGVKEDAFHKGGINIFGKNFGDYNQAIIMKINYE